MLLNFLLSHIFTSSCEASHYLFIDDDDVSSYSLHWHTKLNILTTSIYVYFDIGYEWISFSLFLFPNHIYLQSNWLDWGGGWLVVESHSLWTRCFVVVSIHQNDLSIRWSDENLCMIKLIDYYRVGLSLATVHWLDFDSETHRIFQLFSFNARSVLRCGFTSTCSRLFFIKQRVPSPHLIKMRIELNSNDNPLSRAMVPNSNFSMPEAVQMIKFPPV